MADLQLEGDLNLLVDDGHGGTRRASVDDYKTAATGAATESTAEAMLATLDHLVLIAAARATQIFVQAAPLATWVIAHQMGGHPTVTVVDSGGTLQLGAVVYDSDDQVTVSFSVPFSGRAYLSL